VGSGGGGGRRFLALALKMELEVGALGVGVFGRRRGTLEARVMGSPSNALGTPTLTALAAGALGLEAQQQQPWPCRRSGTLKI
jgi:hypothetical protein